MKSIQLERPMYYKNEFSLRFELGPPEVELWTDRDREIINEEYFRIASQRAFSIFKSAFLPTDEIKICYQIFSDGRQKIKKGNYYPFLSIKKKSMITKAAIASTIGTALGTTHGS